MKRTLTYDCTADGIRRAMARLNEELMAVEASAAAAGEAAPAGPVPAVAFDQRLTLEVLRDITRELGPAVSPHILWNRLIPVDPLRAVPHFVGDLARMPLRSESSRIQQMVHEVLGQFGVQHGTVPDDWVQPDVRLSAGEVRPEHFPPYDVEVNYAFVRQYINVSRQPYIHDEVFTISVFLEVVQDFVRHERIPFAGRLFVGHLAGALTGGKSGFFLTRNFVRDPSKQEHRQQVAAFVEDFLFSLQVAKGSTPDDWLPKDLGWHQRA